MAQEIISVDRLSKSYAGVDALRDVSFSLATGEIRAICGENGAGKSTFVKLLMGITQPDSGSISIDGRIRTIVGPQHAQGLGLGFVAQELSLAPRLSILDNIWLGSADVPLIYRRSRFRARAQEAMQLLGIGDWDLDRPVATLTIGQQQLVEIARLLARQARVLILDEPTATLTDAEIARIVGVLKLVKARGHSIIYISHRLGEVFELCDSVSVFRNGEHVATKPVGEITRDGLIELMLGRSVGKMYPSASAHRQVGNAVVVEGLKVPDAMYDFSFTAPRGKILCIAGQIGSGANMVIRALAGLVYGATGRVIVNGKPMRLGSVPHCVSRNVLFLSEDRAAEGIFHRLKVLDNLVATSLIAHARLGVLNRPSLSQFAARLADRVGIDRQRLRAYAGNLSGGNQQKLLFGRVVERSEPGILLMNEPTRGIDVGARADIYQLMRKLCALGYSLIMTSSDLEEVVGIADIVVTMYRGRAIARYEYEGIDMASIMVDITHPPPASKVAP
jgi:ribose transport system ATP-binding protein/rhamnose transport system ATP-binding protein